MAKIHENQAIDLNSSFDDLSVNYLLEINY